MTDFSIPSNLDEITEDQPVPAGRYDVRIRSVDPKDSAKGKPIILCFLEILDSPVANAKEPMYCVNFPTTGCHKFVEQEFKRFLSTFNVDTSTGKVEPKSLPGLEANITLEDGVDQNGRPCNIAVMNPIP